MNLPPDPDGSDVARLVEVLDRHQVEYLVVGGVAARAYVPSAPPKTSTA
ncbi:MAG: hypothetical protein M3R71_01105 [Actinomycetota bacterium]|nr:hypothetical protein [Actinomycetota bacterium]